MLLRFVPDWLTRLCIADVLNGCVFITDHAKVGVDNLKTSPRMASHYHNDHHHYALQDSGDASINKLRDDLRRAASHSNMREKQVSNLLQQIREGLESLPKVTQSSQLSGIGAEAQVCIVEYVAHSTRTESFQTQNSTTKIDFHHRNELTALKQITIAERGEQKIFDRSSRIVATICIAAHAGVGQLQQVLLWSHHRTI